MKTLNFKFLLKEIPKVLKANGVRCSKLRTETTESLGKYIHAIVTPPYPGYPTTLLVGSGYITHDDGEYFISLYDNLGFTHQSHDHIDKGSREILKDLDAMCQELVSFLTR